MIIFLLGGILIFCICIFIRGFYLEREMYFLKSKINYLELWKIHRDLNYLTTRMKQITDLNAVKDTFQNMQKDGTMEEDRRS
jgi:hypothetical protein